MKRIRGLVGVTVALTALLLVLAAEPLAAGAAERGKPTVERELIEETFFDDFIFDLCGVETNTTQTERNVIQTFPDGSQVVHRQVSFIPEDPTIARERWARTDYFAPDGTLTIKGLAIRLYRAGGGTIILDAGWVRVTDDGLVIRGPHPFLEGGPDAAEQLYC